MVLKLLSNSNIAHTASAVVLCKANPLPKDEVGLIKRVGVNMKHGSILRHLKYTFKAEDVSTKTLMALSRHQAGVDLTVQSSRYTINKLMPTYTTTGCDTVNDILKKHVEDIVQLIEAVGSGEESSSNDDISMLLPQAMNYNFVITINGQALLHLLELRLSRATHYNFREFAMKLFEALPEGDKPIYEDVVPTHKN